MLTTSEGKRPYILRDVLYVPDFTVNLLSANAVTASTEEKVRIEMDSDGARWEFLEDHSTVPIVRHGGLFWLPSRAPNSAGQALAVAANDKALAAVVQDAFPVQVRNAWQLAHERLGHPHADLVKAIFPELKLPPSHVCVSCERTKATRTSIANAARPRDLLHGEMIHSDVMGPFPTSLGGKRFCVTFSDDATRLAHTYLLAHKDEVASAFVQFLADTAVLADFQVRVLHSDGGGEFRSNLMAGLCKDRGIRQQFSPPHTPQRNGVAERLGRTLQDSARAMLATADLPQTYWGAAILHATLLKNILPHSTTGKAPWEDATGRVFDASILRTFGATCFVHVPDNQRGKLDDRARHGTWLGVDLASMSHTVLLKDTGRLVSTHHLSIHEDLERAPHAAPSGLRLGDQQQLLAPQHDTHLGAHLGARSQSPPLEDAQDEEPSTPRRAGGASDNSPPPLRFLTFADALVHGSPSPARNHAQPQTPPLAPQARGGRQQPARAAKGARTAFMVTRVESREPATLAEALTSPQWTAALDDEIKSLQDNNTWTLVPKAQVPASHSVLPCKVVWRIKRNPDNSVARYKARVVCGGHRQKPGIDYDEVFAPTLSIASLRTILSHASAHGHHIHNMDVKTAFLYADLKEEVYMQPPPTVASKDKDGKDLVCRLNKTLYGLHQSPREWHILLTNWLADQGFARSDADPCVFLKDIGTDSQIIVAVFVDDLVCASPSLAVIDAFKKEIGERFKMTDNGHISSVLGLQIDYDRDRRVIKLSQEGFADAILERYAMGNSKPAATPLEPHARLSKADGNGIAIPADKEWYQSVVGSIMYLSVCTRPDLAFSAGALARFMDAPCEHHIVAAKRVLRYIAGTRSLGITYTGLTKDTDTLVGFSDADYAEDSDTRKSTTGLCFMMNGAAITWTSKRQSTVASSTAEAEYTALFSATQEVMFLRQLLSDLGIEMGPTTIMEDNQPAIHIASNPVTSSHSKHFDVRLHYTREKLHDGIIDIKYIETNNMVADMMTKSLDRVKLERHRATTLGCTDV